MAKHQLLVLRVLGIAEGISFFILLFISMPLRKLNPEWSFVREAGSVHGLLVLMYVFTLLDSASLMKWKWKKLFMGLLAACLPFGTFWFDRRHLRPASRD